VVTWHRFAPADFEYDFERDELASHGLEFEEYEHEKQGQEEAARNGH